TLSVSWSHYHERIDISFKYAMSFTKEISIRGRL
ncbi:ZirS family two-partner secretion-like system exoprotein, partial [Salmonella enterica]